ncbi:acyltransferase [Gordonia sp. OPL2]|uniref:acyltransferase n=1 Tax=Gordonia sp. OPL2 TaxID=2486274 RepID=UPI0016557250|nr:acyltransferase [Gordonia sp. OPL2]ROZ89161.1 acyltransferase [Gordonia sp. OPL2]
MTTYAPGQDSAAATTATGSLTRSADAVRSASKRAYLHHVDLIRATTFSLVIFVHCLTQTTDEFTSLPVNTTSLLLHFTRNTFFALTGFVLMYQNYEKTDFRATEFWRRRIKLVIFPYIIWSAVYWLVQKVWAQGRIAEVVSNPVHSLGEFAGLVGWGLSGFQMYFLFVMLQVYLLFPLVLFLVRATARHHGLLLAAALGVQVAITAAITYWQPPAPISDYWWHHYATFVPYQFFILYGAVAAVHRDAIARWLEGKGWWLFGALLVTGTIAAGTYLTGVWFRGQPVHDNDSAFYPYLLPFLVVAIACLYAAAAHWATHWRDFTPRFARAVSYASNRSFSVFLAHVLVLFFILKPQSGGQAWILETFGQPWGTIVAYVGTIGGSLLLVEILRRLPGSSYLTGRPRLPLPGRTS